MWPWTERDNWRWRWPHWLLLIQTSSGILSSALSISFEGDINKQECTQVAGDGGRNGGQVKMLRSWEALVYCSKFPRALVRLIAHRSCLCSQYLSGQSRWKCRHLISQSLCSDPGRQCMTQSISNKSSNFLIHLLRNHNRKSNLKLMRKQKNGKLGIWNFLTLFCHMQHKQRHTGTSPWKE